MCSLAIVIISRNAIAVACTIGGMWAAVTTAERCKVDRVVCWASQGWLQVDTAKSSVHYVVR